jgi:hypothetical protein
MRLPSIPIAILASALLVGCEERVADVPYDAHDSEICRVHGAGRLQAVVPMKYGYPKSDPPAIVQAQRQAFPNAWLEVHGGCEQSFVPGHESPLQGTVMYCPRCRDAEEKWRRQHEKS